LDLLKKLVARTTEQGSRTLVHAGSQGADTHGKYLSHCKVHATEGWAAGAGSKELQDRVWKELTERLEAIQLGVTSNF